MMHLKIRRGLKLTLEGVPKGQVCTLPDPKTQALDLSVFSWLRFLLLKKVGDRVTIGEPLVEDKSCPGRVFVSPACGTIHEVRRGLKRQILSIVLVTSQPTTYFEHTPLKKYNQKELLSYLMKGGIFPHIRVRPCLQLPSLDKVPDAIFIKALDAAPFAPPFEMEILGNEIFFEIGLASLSSLAPCHLIYHYQSKCKALTQATDVFKHTAEGPYPISHASVHIAAVRPIKTNQEQIWTLTASDVILIGRLLKEGRYFPQKIISIAGSAILENQRGFFRLPQGFPIKELMQERLKTAPCRLISGDPLMGTKMSQEDHIKFFDRTVCALFDPEEKRSFAHFFHLKPTGYSALPTYLKRKTFPLFTTSNHGEKRPFIDGQIYQRVMPLPIVVIALIKALLAEDYALAKHLGLLTIAPEDFALPTFICPSKIEMVEIVERGVRAYASEYLIS